MVLKIGVIENEVRKKFQALNMIHKNGKVG